MKKVILLLSVVIAYCSAGAQQWKPYKIDDSVQISLPPGFKTTDTLNQEIISASTAFGNILITKTPDNPKATPDIEKKKHLDQYYSDYLETIRTSSKGTVTDEKDTLLGNLRVKDFTLATDTGGGKQIRSFRLLHENGATYTFQFLYQDLHKEYAAEEKDRFFNLPIRKTQPAKAPRRATPIY